MPLLTFTLLLINRNSRKRYRKRKKNILRMQINSNKIKYFNDTNYYYLYNRLKIIEFKS